MNNKTLTSKNKQFHNNYSNCLKTKESYNKKAKHFFHKQTKISFDIFDKVMNKPFGIYESYFKYLVVQNNLMAIEFNIFKS